MKYPIVLSLLASAALLVACQGGRTGADAVNVFNGTGFHGHTYPGATTPFGLVQLSPDTRTYGWDGCSGYHYSDSVILGFSHTHLSGTGCADLGDFLFTPGVGRAGSLPFRHRDETARPGYYKVVTPGVTVELTATPHTGVHRYTFTGEGDRQILIDATHCIGDGNKAVEAWVRTDDMDKILGKRLVNGWVEGRECYLDARFSARFQAAFEVSPGKIMLIFPKELQQLTIWAGISFLSLENATANVEAESFGKQFDVLLANAREAWDGALGSITVEGGPVEQFYTCLYHTSVTPNNIADAGEKPFYSTLSLWDTFRSWNPLQTLIRPDLVNDMIDSMLAMYRRWGELPIWPLGYGETGCMIGYHSIPVIADAWLCGIRTFDGNKALDAMVSSSNQDWTSPGYNKYGYVPSDLYGQAVSETLEMAYDDWCIARMAENLGRKDVADEYYARSKRYENLFDPATRFFRGKDSKGNWVEPFDPLVKTEDFTEAVPWQFRFFVPHDVQGLEKLMGGREKTQAALDSLFTYEALELTDDIVDMTGLIGEYAHGNEPSHNMAYLFTYLGQPEKTQHYVRRILSELYSATPEGISGNEDCGQMSAWYVMSVLGFYPACPASCEFVLTSPIFNKATIKLGNGKTLTVKADKPEYEYISAVYFNGKKLDTMFITYDDILQGGTLEFKLSETPAAEI